MDSAARNPNLSFLDKHHFLLRRLHSLCGIIPVGVFLINHMLANSTAFLGAQHFDHHIGIIHDLPWLVAIEFGFIFIPLAFHALYGLAIAWQGKPNASQYPYMDNWRYTLQRVTAYVAFAFILLHLAHFRFAYLFGGRAYGDAHPNFFAFTRAGFFGMWLPLGVWMAVYAVGTAAAIYHFCNGIVTFCITWGITVGDAARRKVAAGALVLGLLLAFWAGAALFALSRTTAVNGPAPAGNFVTATR